MTRLSSHEHTEPTWMSSTKRRCLLSDYSEMGATTGRLITISQMVSVVRPTHYGEKNELRSSGYRVTGLEIGTRARQHAIDCGGMAFLLAPQRHVLTTRVPRQSQQHVGRSAILPAKRPIMKTGLILRMGGRVINRDQIISHSLLEPLVFSLPKMSSRHREY
jgi:hypothetical protein